MAACLWGARAYSRSEEFIMDTRYGTSTAYPGQHFAGPVPAGAACNELPGLLEAERSGPEAAISTCLPVLPDAGVESHAERRWSWDALAYPSFRLYFAGSVVSNLGTWFQNTAQALLAYQLTHSVLAIGAVVGAQFSWVLVLGPWAGAVVSRAHSVQRLLIITQLGSAAAAAAMAALQFAGVLNEAWLIAGALALGLAYCFALPAVTVLVPAFVPAGESDSETNRRIRAAVALDHASYNIGRCVAPLLAVLVITRVGFGWAFALNAASFLALAAAVARTRPCSGLRRNDRAKIMDGFRVASKDPRISLLLVIVAAVTVTADPVLILGPALAHHLHLPETWAGYFLSALGAGTILGSFVPMRSPSRVRHAVLPLSFLGLAVTLFALGFNRWLSLGAALIAGCLPAHRIRRQGLAVGSDPGETGRAADSRNGSMGNCVGR